MWPVPGHGEATCWWPRPGLFEKLSWKIFWPLGTGDHMALGLLRTSTQSHLDVRLGSAKALRAPPPIPPTLRHLLLFSLLSFQQPLPGPICG
jgi:hypothetical protein